jgi:hypothetical protein
VGVFAPSLQCEWLGPKSTDPLPQYKRVLVSVATGDLSNDSGASGEIVVVTTDAAAGGEASDGTGAVIRILNAQTCELIETIQDGPRVRATAAPALADLDNNGTLEIITRTHQFSASQQTENTVIAYEWKGGKYGVKWETKEKSLNSVGAANSGWDGVSIHDLNDDGQPEVLGRHGEVFNGQNGSRITAGGGEIVLESEPVIADVDKDGKVELVANKVFRWNGSGWTLAYPGAGYTSIDDARFYAVADFGTPSGGGFDRNAKDGRAEVVSSGGNKVSIHTLEGKQVVSVALTAGGPPTVGDIDKDGQPEVVIADKSALRSVDLECGPSAGPGCAEPWIRWKKSSQDESARTGSTIFDFEGDGKNEAVYADECFLRIYEGGNGEVLFSAFRTSCTWTEQPVVADPDKDSRTEIIVNSNQNCYTLCPAGKSGPYIDPEHKGVRCLKNEDCISGSCGDGFCRCTDDKSCGNNFVETPATPKNKGGLVCTNPLAGTPGTGKVCRMSHPNPDGLQREELNGVKVYRDSLDRWVPTRAIWNQNAYSITNIGEDGKVPKTSAWAQNFLDPNLNNYRVNEQRGGAEDLPDITGVLDKSNACTLSGQDVVLKAKVCNRGLRAVGADMPATFYLGEVKPENILCVSKTAGPVPVPGCLEVTCNAPGAKIPDNATITMVSNDDGTGSGATTKECVMDNNTDFVVIEKCDVPK